DPPPCERDGWQRFTRGAGAARFGRRALEASECRPPAERTAMGTGFRVPVLRVLGGPTIFRRLDATCNPSPNASQPGFRGRGCRSDGGDPRTAAMEYEYIDSPGRLARV